MAIVLDHTIVPAHDKEASARFLARILGLRYEGALSHFAPLRVNDTLTSISTMTRSSRVTTTPSKSMRRSSTASSIASAPRASLMAAAPARSTI